MYARTYVVQVKMYQRRIALETVKRTPLSPVPERAGCGIGPEAVCSVNEIFF